MGEEEKWLCINLLKAIKVAVIYHEMWNSSGHLSFFCSVYSLGLLCSDVHIKKRNIMPKAASFTSHENDSRYSVAPVVIERQ